MFRRLAFLLIFSLNSCYISTIFAQSNSNENQTLIDTNNKIISSDKAKKCTSNFSDTTDNNITAVKSMPDQRQFTGVIKTTKKRFWIFAPKYPYGLYHKKKLIAYLDYSHSRSEIKDFINKDVIVTGDMQSKQYWGSIVVHVSSITGNMQ